MACLLLTISPNSVSAAEDTVDAVTVSVLCDESVLPPRVAKRMEASVVTVGQHILLGHKVTEVTSSREAYEKLVQEVFDRVLVGYSVQAVNITPGTTAHILLKVTPWGDVVRDVSLEMNIAGISPEMAKLVNKDIGNMETEVQDVLVGLPIDAVDWAGSVSKSVIRELLAAKLPEFHSSFDIVSGPHTTVKVALTPMGQTVHDVRVSLHSNIIPNIFLLDAKSQAEEAAKSLRGLPVAFVERHRDILNNTIQNAASQGTIAKYGLETQTNILPGTDTDIAIHVNSNRYHIILEGYMDIGRKEDNTSAKLHAGQYVGKWDEAFVEVNFSPSDVSWKFSPGWGHTFGKNTSLGFKYNLNDQQNVLWLNQILSHNFSLRCERTPATGYNEVGLRYKLHEFVSAEYVYTDKEKYLRLVGNL